MKPSSLAAMKSWLKWQVTHGMSGGSEVAHQIPSESAASNRSSVDSRASNGATKSANGRLDRAELDGAPIPSGSRPAPRQGLSPCAPTVLRFVPKG